MNLTLSAGATNYAVNNVQTVFIDGTGVFNIQATMTQLIFNPIGNNANPADLGFSDGTLPANLYSIGSHGAPAIEVASTGDGLVAANIVPIFPVVWATASNVPSPEPSVLALIGMGLVGLNLARRKKSKV